MCLSCNFDNHHHNLIRIWKTTALHLICLLRKGRQWAKAGDLLFILFLTLLKSHIQYCSTISLCYYLYERSIVWCFMNQSKFSWAIPMAWPLFPPQLPWPFSLTMKTLSSLYQHYFSLSCWNRCTNKLTDWEWRQANLVVEAFSLDGWLDWLYLSFSFWSEKTQK